MLTMTPAELTKYLAAQPVSEIPYVVIPATHPYAAHLLHDLAARFRDTGRPELQQEAADAATLVRGWQERNGTIDPEAKPRKGAKA